MSRQNLNSLHNLRNLDSKFYSLPPNYEDKDYFGVVSGAVTHTNEFVGQVQELSEKLGIELPIALPQSQNAIGGEAIDSAQP